MSDKDATAYARGAINPGDLWFTSAADLAGDPITPANEGFWHIAWNLFSHAYGAGQPLDPTGPEVARLVELSKAIAASSVYHDWESTWAICDRLFESLDGGEELGLSDDWRGVDWYDEAQRTKALQIGMQFHRVPKAFHTRMVALVTDLMLAKPKRWQFVDADGTHPLPQPWAATCTYVVFAIAERVKLNFRFEEGQHRGASLRSFERH